MKRKKLRKWAFSSYLALCGLWLLSQFFAYKFPEHNIKLVEQIVQFIIIGVVMPGFALLLGKYDYPYADYLESDDTSKPTIRGAISSVIDAPQGLDFNRLKTEIAGKWQITFSDDTGRLLKFKTKWHFRKSKITAAWLQFDADTGKIQLECFPLLGKQHGYLAEKMQKEIAQCLTACKPS